MKTSKPKGLDLKEALSVLNYREKFKLAGYIFKMKEVKHGKECNRR